MEIVETKIPGCYTLKPNIFADKRGNFVKIFHKDLFLNHRLETDFEEQYYSCSHHNVLRGLHFQLPPEEHTKVVSCIDGEVMDVVVDLRVGSPTYGKYEIFSLQSENAHLIYIPPGLAHGFYVTSDRAMMMYLTSTVYVREYDTGIHWNSAGIVWPSINPIVSDKDEGLTPLNEFKSPFKYAVE